MKMIKYYLVCYKLTLIYNWIKIFFLASVYLKISLKKYKYS